MAAVESAAGGPVVAAGSLVSAATGCQVAAVVDIAAAEAHRFVLDSSYVYSNKLVT